SRKEIAMAALHSANVPDMLVVTYLHMTRREQFCPCPAPRQDDVRIVPMNSPDVKFYRFLYGSVGENIRWRDRLLMSDAELEANLAKPGTEISVLYVRDVPAGYIELVNEGKATEIAYFGLRPAYQGKGLGKYLLSYGIERAWQRDV